MSEVPTQRRLADLKAALLCAGLAALTPLLARPTTNLPFNDEFSYLHMARTVAKTGTYTFDGWAAAAVGPQAYWGAAFILAFGDSAFALRCSTLVLAAITGAILYALARHAGLTRPFAVQSSAACMLSPLVLPWSASFMTDIPGFCFACLAVLAATYALIARTPFVRTLAFAALLLAGYTGGWMRQVVWLAVLLLPPLILHLRREHFPLRATLYLAFTLLTFATIRFIDGQPYNLSDSVLPTLLAPFQQPLATFRISISLLHTVIFTLWPLLIPLIFGLRRRLTPRLALLIVALAIAGHLASPPVTPSGDTRYPWFGNSFTPYGLLDFPTMPGWISPLFPLGLLKFVALLNWFLLAALLAFTLKLKFHHVAFSNLKARPTLQLLTLFSAGVLYLSLARSVATVGFDRYLIPLLPLPILALQLTRQWLTVTIPITDPIEHRRWRRRLARARREAARSEASQTLSSPTTPWARAMPTSNGFVYLAIALLALFSLSLIHEHHRNGDARLEAVSRLTALGIPRHHISAGFEFDGETQLLEWGYLNHPRLKSPPNAFLPVRRDPAWPLEFFWFLPHTPAIQPEYIISRSSVPLYADAGLGNVTYRFFLPPFRRTLSILRLEDPAQRPLILLGPPPPGKTVRSNKPITTER